VAVDLHDTSGLLLGRVVHSPGRRDVTPDPDLQLVATAVLVDDAWAIDLRAARAAHWVCLEVAEANPADNWFHLAPGIDYRVRVTGTAAPQGTVRALNSAGSTEIVVAR